MISDLGSVTLVLSIVVSLYALYAALRRRISPTAEPALSLSKGSEQALQGPLRPAQDNAWLASARHAVIAVFLLLTVSVLAVVYSLVTGDYQVNYAYMRYALLGATLLP